MKANPSSFQAKLMLCRKHEEVFNHNIGSEVMKRKSLVKLLGVLVGDNLRFNSNVSNLFVKAAWQTYVTQNCKIYSKWMSSKYKVQSLNIYQAFISSNYNHCDIMWHFCIKHSTCKIERKNALRAVLNDYTYSSYWDIRQVVKGHALYVNTMKNIATEIIKSAKELNPCE